MAANRKPVFLDQLVEALGAKSIPYKDRMICRGAGVGLRSSFIDVSINVTRARLQSMKEADAECIVNVCPFCHLQFDSGQQQIAQKWKVAFNIPVIYYTKLLGLALGSDPYELGLHLNAIDSLCIIKYLKE